MQNRYNAQQSMALSAGTILGSYEIVEPLGAGGMGEVYRANDRPLDRVVAIKILPASIPADPLAKRRFEREAKTISSLNHPNICVLHDIGHQDGVDYIVMECVEGESLAKRLEEGPLPLEQTLKYGAQIADALDKAHRSGIVHRDFCVMGDALMRGRSFPLNRNFPFERSRWPQADLLVAIATWINASAACAIFSHGFIDQRAKLAAR
jgi:Protein kinase domain